MNALEARITLLAQHERIRGLLALCSRLAGQHDAGEPVASELDEALAQLRDEVAAHNHAETEIIAELLQGPGPWSARLVDRMLEEHLAEHAAFWELLCGTQAEVADRIVELAEDLDAHMAAEERTFLAPTTLRDDVIRTRTCELAGDGSADLATAPHPHAKH
jgi:iron-sulfur cluster repair protein YtfE (RIC family)